MSDPVPADHPVSMTPAPDLKTPEGIAAFKTELGRVMWAQRSIGLGLILAAAVAMIVNRTQGHGMDTPLGYGAAACLAVGWALMAFVIIKRRAYQRRRIGGG